MTRIIASAASLALWLLLSATSTYAQSRTFITGDAGYYWWTDAGAAIPQDGHTTEFGGVSTGQKVRYDVGLALDFAGGYAFNRYFATEVQLGATWNSIDSVEGASIHDTTLSTLPILANLVLQYPIPRTVVVPYIGAGVGGAATWFDTDGFTQPVPGGGYVTLHGSETDFVFAWQASAGLRFELNPQMSLGLGYHYLYVDSSSYTYSASHHRGPDLDLGLSSHQSHIVALVFQMKF